MHIQQRIRRLSFLVVFALLASAAAAVVAFPAASPERAHADHEQAVQPLARSGFTDQISALVQIRLAGTDHNHVVLVGDGAEMMVAEVRLHPGEAVPGHTHPGPAFVAVVEGEMTVTHAMDCIPRVYGAGDAWVDPGQGNVHRADNFGDTDLVVYVTFLGLPPGAPATTLVDDPGC
jgi:quercetin dioxygenase-like cupin family protein